jgi:metal-responsive CopG/Arc/MetJ family transcriptional regulator
MCRYTSSMKIKTSITLSEELLEVMDGRVKQQKKTRSDFIETAVWAFIEQLAREEQDARDLEIINRRADFLNEEAADVLEYQVPL